MINFLLRNLVLFLLWLRYDIRVTGLKKILERGREGVLFLPNHPALIEPMILVTYLNGRLPTRVIADETQLDRPVIGWGARRIGAMAIPDTVKVGSAGRSRIDTALDECARHITLDDVFRGHVEMDQSIEGKEGEPATVLVELEELRVDGLHSRTVILGLVPDDPVSQAIGRLLDASA